eukprot:196142-Chlamydomonas_euryale.AAC.1
MHQAPRPRASCGASRTPSRGPIHRRRRPTADRRRHGALPCVRAPVAQIEPRWAPRTPTQRGPRHCRRRTRRRFHTPPHTRAPHIPAPHHRATACPPRQTARRAPRVPCATAGAAAAGQLPCWTAPGALRGRPPARCGGAGAERWGPGVGCGTSVPGGKVPALSHEGERRMSRSRLATPSALSVTFGECSQTMKSMMSLCSTSGSQTWLRLQGLRLQALGFRVLGFRDYRRLRFQELRPGAELRAGRTQPHDQERGKNSTTYPTGAGAA